jgi:hypothetical protein
VQLNADELSVLNGMTFQSVDTIWLVGSDFRTWTLTVHWQTGNMNTGTAKFNTLHKHYSENRNKMQQYINILLSLILNETQHVSGDKPLIIRSLKPHKLPLVLHNSNLNVFHDAV